MPRFSQGFAAVALLAVMLLVGCTKQKDQVFEPGKGTGVNVTGTVKYKGEPLPGGVVSFVSVSDPKDKASGNLDRQGKYTVKGAPIGEVYVTVDTEAIRGQDPEVMAKGGTGVSPPPEVLARTPKYIKIDPKFADPKKSGFKHTLVVGENAKDLDLK